MVTLQLNDEDEDENTPLPYYLTSSSSLKASPKKRLICL